MQYCWRLLGSHRLAVILLALLALAAMLGGTLPQSSRLNPEKPGQLQDWSAGVGWMESLRLVDVFGSPWFWGLCILLLFNLAAGMAQLVLRRPDWRTARPWGVLIGHGGLLLMVCGGMVSALTGFGAHLELTEGEVWQGAPEKLVTDRGRPAGFGAGLRLDRIAAEVGQDSRLRELRLSLSWQEAGGSPQQGEVSANRPVTVAGHRIYPDNTFGYGAVLERLLPDGERRLLLVHFPLPRAQWGSAHWAAERSRAIDTRGETRYYQFRLEGEPARLKMTVGRAPEQLFEGWLRPGDSVDVAGERMTLRQVSPWAGLYLAADRGVSWVFAGMVLAVAGFLLGLLTWPQRIAPAAGGGQ